MKVNRLNGINFTIYCITFFLFTLPTVANAAQAVFAAEITSVSPSLFTGGQSETVRVFIRSSNGSGNVILEADSWPSGWTVSPKNVNPTITQGTTYQLDFTVTSPASGGSGTIVWRLYDDDWGVHPSGSTLLATRNQSVSASVSKPDLTQSSASINKTTVYPGDTLNVNVTVWNTNVATATANSGYVYYYWKKDSWSFTDPYKVGSDSYPSLGVNDTSPESFSYTVPTSASPGTYYFYYWIDATGTSDESNENNNAFYWTITVSKRPPETPGTPDLSSSDDTGYNSSDNITYQTTNLTFSWGAASDATHYYYGWDDSTPNEGPITGTSVSVTAPSTHGNHTFYVRGWNDGGYGPSSSLTVYIDQNRPSISNLDLRDTDDTGQYSNDNKTKDTNVRFTWTGNTNGGSGIYKYWYGWSTSANDTSTNNTYADVSPPSNNGTYTFYVGAEAVSGLWAYYPTYTDQETVTWDTVAPYPPYFDGPREGFGTNATPTLDWSGVSDAWKYQAYVREDGLPYLDNRESLELSSSTTQWTVSPSLGIKNWGWQVKVWDIAGNEGAYGRDGVNGDWGHFYVYTSSEITGVPDYSQGDQDGDGWTEGDCGPVAASCVLAYFDYKPYNGIVYWNLVDNGSALTTPPGDLSPIAGYANRDTGLVHDLRETMSWDTDDGTSTWNTSSGIEVLCNDSEYGNNLSFDSTWSVVIGDYEDLEAEINSSRPAIMQTVGDDTYGKHYLTAFGCHEYPSSRSVHVHDNWDTTGDYWLDWDSEIWGIIYITPGGIPSDHYDPDDSYSASNFLDVDDQFNFRQTHNFFQAGDNDWISFSADSGKEYTIETKNLGSGCDTYMYLYSTNGTSEITHDNDGGSGSASKIVWKCTQSDTYFVRVRHNNSSTSGHNTNYDIEISPSQDFYTILASAGSNGSINPAGTIYKYPGESQQFTATPNSGYTIDRWYVDGSPVQTGGMSYMLAGIQSNRTVYVTFKLIQHTITATDGSGGDISPSGSIQVNQGDNQSFTATPIQGFLVDTWYVDGDPEQTGGSIFTLYNIQSDHTIHVTFKLIEFTIDASAGPNGSISPSGSFAIEYNESQMFIATPNSNYVIDIWYVDGSQVQVGGLTYTLDSITANHTVYVSFKAQNQYTITATAGTGGVINPSGAVLVTEGRSQQFTANPNANYVVDQWYVDSSLVQTGGSTYTLTNVQAGHTVHVTFTYVPPQYTITTSAGAGGVINPNGMIVVNEGDIQCFDTIPDAQYVVDQWYLDDLPIQTGGTSYCLSSIQSNHTVHVTFSYVPVQYRISVFAGVNGTVDPNGELSATQGSDLLLTATPDPNYMVSQWLIDGSVAQIGFNEFNIENIQTNHTIEVEFMPIQPIIYVDLTNTSGNENGTAAYPFSTIQRGIDAATDGDTVLVSEGQYNEWLMIESKTITISSCKLENPDDTIICGSGYQTIRIINSLISLKGFTVTCGETYSEDPSGHMNGAGIYANMNSSLYMSHCSVKSNFCSIGDSPGFGDGGGYSGVINGVGVCIEGYGEIRNCVIADNQVLVWDQESIYSEVRGIGIYLNRGLISDSVIQNNKVVSSGFSQYGLATVKGAGLYCGPETLVTKNVIHGNEAIADLGWHSYDPYYPVWLTLDSPIDALAIGGGLYIENGIANNNIIHSNKAVAKGNNNAQANAPECDVFEGKGGNATTKGAGVFAINSTLSNNTISGCQLTSQGGQGVKGVWNGEWFDCLSDNGYSIMQGGGIYLDSDSILVNTIIWDNLPNQVDGQYCTNVRYCDIADGTCEGTNGNISIDPLFADSSMGDFHLKSEYGRWDPNGRTLVYDDVTSPCIDAGDPNSDWTAELWPHGKRINMGAYGGTAEASNSDVGNIADLDISGTVDFKDYSILANGWYSANSHIIPKGIVVVDGDISEWSSGVVWEPLGKIYSGHPDDISEARFALRWDNETNKIYVAVVVYDSDNVFRDDYGSWDASDRIEIYSQGDAAGGTGWWSLYNYAQQYYVAPNTASGSWATWASGDTNDIGDVLEYAVAIIGEQLIYEASVTPFDHYGGFTGEETVITNLEVGNEIGFDVVVLTRYGTDGYGMLAENTMTGKYTNADQFARYILVDQVPILDCLDIVGDLDRNCILDLWDLMIFADSWLATEPNAPDPNVPDMTWVSINDEGFNGEMSKYETTNAQYCQFLNDALTSEAVTVSGNYVVGASGPYSGQNYYDLSGSGFTDNGATNGGASRINWTGSSFTVDSGFENHPVTYVSWYGSTAFANYYGWRLPTEWEWQAVADFDGTYVYGHGPGTMANSLANYYNSTHPYGATAVGAYGTIHGYGMCDMAGNVWEWTSSLWDTGDNSRVLRGGSWDDFDSLCTVSHRFSISPYRMGYYLGFRVCRDVMQTIVPNVTGMTQAEAEAAIVDASLVVGTITQDNHATIPSGNVISSEPVAGAEVSIDSAVDIVISLGHSIYFTPDQSALLAMTQQWVGAGTTVYGPLNSYADDVLVPNAVKFVASMRYGDADNPVDGEATIAIGKNVTTEDFSSFDGIQMHFASTDHTSWSVNVWFIASGITYNNGWELLNTCENASIKLDFGGISTSSITSYGFEVKGYMDANPREVLTNPSNGDEFRINVSPVVPE